MQQRLQAHSSKGTGSTHTARVPCSPLASSPYLVAVSLGLQVCLKAAEQGDTIAGLSLQSPVAMQPLHELALPLDG